MLLETLRGLLEFLSDEAETPILNGVAKIASCAPCAADRL